jgi:hypothetical protein
MLFGPVRLTVSVNASVPLREATPATGTAVMADAACLALITIFSALPYVAQLGFYSDDWSIVSGFHFAADEGTRLEYLLKTFAARPVHGAYAALLFELFGTHPAGYHIANTGVLAASVVILYLLLVRVGVTRLQSFAAVAIFIILPQLSTVRVWIAAAQIPVSMLFALASLHGQLTYVQTGRRLWAALAVAAALASLATYEIFGPALVGFSVWMALSRAFGARLDFPDRGRRIALVLGIVAAVAVAGALKVMASERGQSVFSPYHYLHLIHQFLRPDFDWRVDYGLNIFAAPLLHFWFTLVGWARAAFGVFAGHFNQTEIALAAAMAGLTYWRLGRGAEGEPGTKYVFVLGVAMFILGHATFLFVMSILFTPTGMGNRVLVAAAIGVAMIFAATVGLCCGSVGQARRAAFSGIIAVIVGLGALRVAFIAQHWSKASQLQEAVLSRAKADLHRLPAGSTLILDGVCPYHGPGVIFESSWDVAGAMSLLLQRPISGDAVSPRMTLTARGLETSIYKEPSIYRYGPTLFVYNPSLRLAAPLPNAGEARRYFARRDRWPSPCPSSFVGHGSSI